MRIDLGEIPFISHVPLAELRKSEDSLCKKIWDLFTKCLQAFFCSFSNCLFSSKVKKISAPVITPEIILIAACSRGNPQSVERAINECLKSDPEYFRKNPRGGNKFDGVGDYPLNNALKAVFKNSGTTEERLEIFRMLIPLNLNLVKASQEVFLRKSLDLEEYQPYINLFVNEFECDISGNFDPVIFIAIDKAIAERNLDKVKFILSFPNLDLIHRFVACNLTTPLQYVQKKLTSGQYSHEKIAILTEIEALLSDYNESFSIDPDIHFEQVLLVGCRKGDVVAVKKALEKILETCPPYFDEESSDVTFTPLIRAVEAVLFSDAENEVCEKLLDALIPLNVEMIMGAENHFLSQAITLENYGFFFPIFHRKTGF